MNELNALTLSVFGFVAMLTWWLGSLLGSRQETKIRNRLRADSRTTIDKTRSGGREAIGSLIFAVGHAAAKPFMPKTREKQSAIRRQLGYAGIYAPSAIKAMQGVKVLLVVVGIIAGYLGGLALDFALLGISAGGLVGYLAPTFWLKGRINANRAAIERALPDALDLLVVCVEAGLTLDAAIQRVGQEFVLAHPRLAREMELTHMETRIGVARMEALRNMGIRTGIPAVQLLASVLTQAERFGTSVANSLRIQAETLRTSRQFAAEEQAAKAAVKLAFPVVLFIFPAVLIVLAGPAGISLFNSALFN